MAEQKRKSLSEWRRTTKRKPLGKTGPREVDPVYRYIGSVVLEMRERLGVTQQALADEIGMTRASVANLEAGKQALPLHRLPHLADALCIRPIDLLPPQWNKMRRPQ